NFDLFLLYTILRVFFFQVALLSNRGIAGIFDIFLTANGKFDGNTTMDLSLPKNKIAAIFYFHHPNKLTLFLVQPVSFQHILPTQDNYYIREIRFVIFSSRYGPSTSTAPSRKQERKKNGHE
ncbi:hypothetical protein ACJX0J_041313, partial [Zea mays]